ncbi:MAG: hypothetical protein ACI9P5_003883 [Saprospiraceae bacterium]|jgi:hypothetical protein
MNSDKLRPSLLSISFTSVQTALVRAWIDQEANKTVCNESWNSIKLHSARIPALIIANQILGCHQPTKKLEVLLLIPMTIFCFLLMMVYC